MTNSELLAIIKSRCIEDGPCWIWKGATDGHGRPQMRYEKKTCYTRRVVRELVDGSPPPHLVASKCGNKMCVSPECSVHANDRIRAKLAADRGAFNRPEKFLKGMMTKRAKSHISDELVQQIKNADGPCSRIALETNVSLSHVKAIRRGAARRDLANPFAGLFTGLAANDPKTRRRA